MQDFNKEKTGKRIRELREAAKETQSDLAELLGVKRQIISYYENGDRVPNIEQIMRIANHYNTTTDYLLGRTNAWTTDKDLKFVCEYMGLSEAAINYFFRSDTALRSRMVDFFNILAKSETGILRLSSLMGNLAEYKIAMKQIILFGENEDITKIEEIKNDIDICQFRAERDFRDLLPAYCGNVAYYVFDDRGNDNGDNQETK